MMGYWLDKVLGADNDTDNFTKLVPLVIFFVIWLFGAIAKAMSGKKGVEKKPAESKDKHQPGFDKLAKNIRERYTAAREQARRAVEQEESEQFMPPSQVPQPKPAISRRSEPIPDKKPIASPIYAREGPTLKVVVEKPAMRKVESALHKVDALTSENAKVSGEVVIHRQHPYLAELAGQYATQDGFRKAILNYEILGPPLALREKLGSHLVL